MIFDRNEIAAIKQIAEEMGLSWDYEFVGVRVQEQAFDLGTIKHRSHVWDNGEDTGAELDGVCACKLERLGVNRYYGNHAAIICGNDAEYGEDDGEIIIRDAVVVKILR